MNVNFEFLDEEPVENIVTCLHYQFDKVVFFGYQNIIDKSKNKLEEYLKQTCNVNEVCFFTLSEKKLDKTLSTMENAIENEVSRGNRIFFDITGGEDVVLVAFGMLCDRHDYPLHIFRIEDNMMVNLSDACTYSILEDVPKQDIKLTVESIIKLRGGKIKSSGVKQEKRCTSEDYINDTMVMWQLTRELDNDWTKYSALLAYAFNPKGDSLSVQKSPASINSAILFAAESIRSQEKLDELLDKLEERHLIKNLCRTGGTYSFSYKNKYVQRFLTTAGDALEMYVGSVFADTSDDYIIGASLDWDGIEGMVVGKSADIYNEIDVLSIKDNILYFVSCKDGIVGADMADDELYKLDSVVRRFGGKYKRAMLVATKGIPETKIQRAAEMGIEVKESL